VEDITYIVFVLFLQSEKLRPRIGSNFPVALNLGHLGMCRISRRHRKNQNSISFFGKESASFAFPTTWWGKPELRRQEN
jgi:hypothetical protein